MLKPQTDRHFLFTNFYPKNSAHACACLAGPLVLQPGHGDGEMLGVHKEVSGQGVGRDGDGHPARKKAGHEVRSAFRK